MLTMRTALYHPWSVIRGGIERTIMGLVARGRRGLLTWSGDHTLSVVFPALANLDNGRSQGASVNRSMFEMLRSVLHIASQKLPLDYGVDAVFGICDGMGELIIVRSRFRPNIKLCFTLLRAASEVPYNQLAKATLEAPRKIIYDMFKHLFDIAKTAVADGRNALANSVYPATQRHGWNRIARDQEVIYLGVVTGDRLSFHNGSC